MRASESTDKIDAAMARVQAALKPVAKDGKVDVESKKTGDKWASRFSTFEALYEACHPHLTANGVVFYQGGEWVQGGGERLVTRLSIEGQWIESSYPIKTSRDGAQGFGGGISFARRWGLGGLVGLIPHDVEEQQGYRDERPVRPQRAKAAAGLPERVTAILASSHEDELTRRVIEARSIHALPDEATAVERATSTWFVQALGAARDLDALTVLRDACNKVKPRGGEVREAIRIAETRLINGNA